MAFVFAVTPDALGARGRFFELTDMHAKDIGFARRRHEADIAAFIAIIAGSKEGEGAASALNHFLATHR